jgi:hypothetical protein
MLFSATLLALALSAPSASDPSRVTGDYVEARTAQVFAGGCIMGSEGEPSGREAILGWRVTRGTVNGVSLDGLSVVAAVAADINLGTHELGGAKPTILKSILLVDSRATAAQRDALVAMAKGLAPRVIAGEVEVRSAPIAFSREADSVKLTAGEATVDTTTKFEHSPACGAITWFSPLAKTDHAQVGQTRLQEWRGPSLRGVQWRDVSGDKKSSFVGTFTYSGQ